MSARVAIFCATTPLHVGMHDLSDRVTLVPMPMRDDAESMRRHIALSRANRVVADKEHEGLAVSIASHLPVHVAAPPRELQDWPRSPESPYACLRTGGTTGAPKVVDVPRQALAAHRVAAIERLSCDENSAWLASLPMWHIGGVGIVDRCRHGGGRLVLPTSTGGVPDGITHVSLVPTMLHRLLSSQAPPASLRCALVGGDRLDPGLARAALEAGWPVHASYGLTEACGQVATALPHEVAAHPGTCGLPLDGVDLRIVVEGEEVDAGVEGEIVVAGPTLAVPGPLRTGDLGHVDAAGRLFVTGRADDRIVTGGEKAWPERIEDVLRDCPGVADVGVAGVPDDEWGQRVVAFIVPEADPPAAAAVRSFARTRLAAHEVPREVRLIDALPRTSAGKLRRGVLRLWYHQPA